MAEFDWKTDVPSGMAKNAHLRAAMNRVLDRLAFEAFLPKLPRPTRRQRWRGRLANIWWHIKDRARYVVHGAPED